MTVEPEYIIDRNYIGYVNSTMIKVLGLTFFLIVVKGIGAYFTGNIILGSSLLDSFNDSMGILTAYFGLKLALKKPNEKFKFGYYKAENLATLIISAIIISAGIFMIFEGIQKLLTAAVPTDTILGPAIGIIIIIVSYAQSYILIKCGRKINSQALSASGMERRMDILQGLAVFIGIILGNMGIPYVEGLFGIGISIIIIKTGFGFGKEAILSLLDISPSPELEEKLKKFAESFEGIKGVGDIKLRKAGNVVFGEISVFFPAEAHMDRVHAEMDYLEKEIYRNFPEIIGITIHPEPAVKTREIVALPIIDPEKGGMSEISEHFGHCAAVIFYDVDKESGNYRQLEIIVNKFVKDKVRAGLKLSKLLLENRKFDTLITVNMGDIAFHFLRDNMIKIIGVPPDGREYKAEELIGLYMKGKLKPLPHPTRSKD